MDLADSRVALTFMIGNAPETQAADQRGPSLAGSTFVADGRLGLIIVL
jgi:hypothetical protein